MDILMSIYTLYPYTSFNQQFRLLRMELRLMLELESGLESLKKERPVIFSQPSPEPSLAVFANFKIKRLPWLIDAVRLCKNPL